MTGVALGANRHVIMGMIQLLRPGAVLASATICLVGALLTGLANWTDVLLASGAVGLAVAASNAFNDIVDLDADRLNTPDRALPSGRVSIRAASLVCWSLASAAVLAAVFLGVGHAVTVVAVLGASAWYSLRLKKVLIVGPVVVALLLALALVFGASIDPTMSLSLIHI